MIDDDLDMAWPLGSVGGVEREARAVEREARALEREAGGIPFPAPNFRSLRAAADRLLAICRALQDEVDGLDDYDAALLRDVCNRIVVLVEEIRNRQIPPADAGLRPGDAPAPPPPPPPPRRAA